MKRSSLPAEITDARIIAVLRGVDPDRCLQVGTALARAGIGVFEVTMDSPDAARSISSLAEHGLVGAGTVMDVADAERAVTAGARFLVSPHTDMKVVRWAIDREVPVIPGAFTPTEVATAWSAGSTAVKVFPASVGGPGMIKALLGPLTIPLIPTGGVTAENAGDFLDAGAIAVGLGGWLTSEPDLGILAHKARSAVAACRR